MERFQDYLDNYPTIERGLRSRSYRQWHAATTRLMKILMSASKYDFENIQVFRFGSDNCGYAYFPTTERGLRDLSKHVIAELGIDAVSNGTFDDDEAGSPFKQEMGDISRDEWESLKEHGGC